MNNPVVVPANRRGGYVLINDLYRFVRNRTRQTKITWRCTEKFCGAILQTNYFDVKDEQATILGKILHYFVRCIGSNIICILKLQCSRIAQFRSFKTT